MKKIIVLCLFFVIVLSTSGLAVSTETCSGWSECIGTNDPTRLVTARYGDNLGVGAWELSIKDITDGLETVVAQDNFVWTSGQAEDISIGFDTSGLVTLTVDTTTTSFDFDDSNSKDYVLMVVKSGSLGNIADFTGTIAGFSFNVQSNGQGVVGIKFYDVPDNFDITGTGTLTWTSSPENEFGPGVYLVNTDELPPPDPGIVPEFSSTGIVIIIALFAVVGIGFYLRKREAN